MNDNRTPTHWAIADLEAEDALIDIAIAVQRLTERTNRKYGQHMRYHMARIGMAKLEYGIKK